MVLFVDVTEVEYYFAGVFWEVAEGAVCDQKYYNVGRAE